MRKILFMCLLVLTTQSMAATLPSLPANSEESPHKLFISSQTRTGNEFDSWLVDSGYSYSLFDSVDLYVAARVDNSSDKYGENGFLSGVSYSFNERISLKSTLLAKRELQEGDIEADTVVSAEVSSRVRLSEHLDLHATVDYEQWQQGVEVGLGFRF